MERRQVWFGLFVLLGITVVLVLGAETIYQRFLSPEPQPPTTTELRQLSEQGVLITAVLPNTPAYEANLQRGDIILAVNNTAVNTIAELRQAISQSPIDELILTVLQGSERQTVAVALNGLTEIGLHVDDGTTQDTIPLQVDWVQVDGVEAASPASLAGLQAGDIVVIVAGEIVLTPEELITLIQTKTIGEELPVTIRREEQTLTTNLTLSASPDDPERPYMGIQLVP